VIPPQREAAGVRAGTVDLVIPPDCAGLRLDQALARLFPEVSRSRVQQWIHDERVRVDGKLRRVRDIVRGGENVSVAVPAAAEGDWPAQALPLEVVYEDDTLLVINKPPGLVVHPGAGNPEGTLLNALLHRAPELRQLARAGIVHRLDKETSGLMVVARTEAARLDLIEQLSARSVEREYLALLSGTLISGGTVDAPIGRHPRERTRMAVHAHGREAVSHYRVEKRYRAHTLVRVKLESGRTHQIRVHMAHLKYPVVGDPEYGGRLRIPPGASDELKQFLHAFKRQALHAAKLGLIHPATGKKMHWSAPVPEDMAALLRALAKDVRAHGG
jgi:23S rRNA pseudouridine1911/1915/1917 synthase